MSPRAFMALLTVTVASSAVAAAVIATQPDFATGSLTADAPMFPQLASAVGEVQQVRIDHPSYALQLDRRGDVWVASDRGDFPVVPSAAADLVAGMAALNRIEQKTNNPDWYGYVRVAGADAPTADRGIRVAMSTGSGASVADAVLGRGSASIGYSQIGGMFLRPSDQANAWLAEGRVNVPSTLSDWVGRLFTVSGVDIASVVMRRGDTVLLDAAKPEANNPDYAMRALAPEVGAEGSTISPDGMRNLTQLLVSVTADDLRGRDGLAVPADAKRIVLTTWDGLQLTVTAVPDGERTWVMFDAVATDPAKAEAVARAEEIVAKVGKWAFVLPEHRTALALTDAADVVLPPGAEPGTPLPGPGAFQQFLPFMGAP